MKYKPSTLLFAGLFGLAQAGFARDLRLGLQGNLSAPTGGTRDLAKPGFGAGVFVDWHLQGGHVLRPRFDFNRYGTHDFSGTNQSGVLVTSDDDLSTYALGADYLYYLGGKPEGWFFSAGLSAMRYEIRRVFNPGTPQELDSPLTRTRPAVALGFGYGFSRNLEINFRFCSSEKVDGQASGFRLNTEMNTSHLGVAYRF